MTHDLQQYVKEWLQKANNDLLAAHRLIDIEPMIHDTDFLLSECSQLDPVFDTIDTLNINDFAVRIRYPDTGLLPEPGEAKEYLEIATNVSNLVKERIVFPVS